VSVNYKISKSSEQLKQKIITAASTNQLTIVGAVPGILSVVSITASAGLSKFEDINRYKLLQ
jgi:hypothetical protein